MSMPLPPSQIGVPPARAVHVASGGWVVWQEQAQQKGGHEVGIKQVRLVVEINRLRLGGPELGVDQCPE